MQLDTVIPTGRPPKDDSWSGAFFAAINRLWGQLASIINGQIGFGDGVSTDNIDGKWISTLTVIGNFTVNHGLGRVPVGYLMVKTDAFENLKFVAATGNTITLAAQNGGANILLFVF